MKTEILKRKYLFARIKFSKSERLWLAEVAKMNFESYDPRLLKVRLAGRLETGFDYTKISTMLLSSDGLTLLGLWYADPNHSYFESTSNVINAIKKQMTGGRVQFVFSIDDIMFLSNLDKSDSSRIIKYCFELGFFSSYIGKGNPPDINSVAIDRDSKGLDKILYFKNIYDALEDFYIIRSSSSIPAIQPSPKTRTKIQKAKDEDVWHLIENNYNINKRAFGKKIGFIKNLEIRKRIFRDVEQCFSLAEMGYVKPAIILAGAVIEEILRQLLQAKKITMKSNRFEDYINACVGNNLLYTVDSNLSVIARIQRNTVHIENEVRNKLILNKSHSKIAVSSVFSLVSGLKT